MAELVKSSRTGKLSCRLLLPAALLYCSPAALAQDAAAFPTRPIKIITPTAAGGPPLLTASGAFMVGAHPGGATGGDMPDPWQPARPIEIGDLSQLDSFEEFLCLARHGRHVRMEFAEHLIGAVSLPALHGGAVAARQSHGAREVARAQCTFVAA